MVELDLIQADPNRYPREAMEFAMQHCDEAVPLLAKLEEP